MGYVVTGIVPHQIGNTTFLVQGEDYLLAEFAKSLLSSHCSGGKKCMIVDNSGYVIWFEGLDRAHNYLLELLPTLTIDGFMITADDKNSNLYRHQRSEAGNDDFDINFRPDLKVSRSTYTSQTTRTASWNYTYCSDVNGQVIKRKLFMDDSILTDIGGVEVKSIPKTNLFIISIYDSLKFQHAYTHSTQKNTHYNFGFRMPSAMSYDSCKNDFPSTIANCQPTPPELNKKYLGQLKTTGFQNEKRTLIYKFLKKFLFQAESKK